MKRFLLNLALVSVVVGVLYYLLSLFANWPLQQSSNYMAAMIDKHQRLDSIQQPKIIFVGGSNLTFGLDSKAIQEELGVPVVNLGLHAALGVDFMLNEAKESVRPGDIVFISIEYYLDRAGAYRLKRHVTTLYPPAGQYFRMNLKEDILIHTERTRENLQFKFNGRPPDTTPLMYKREGFNEYGDGIGHLESRPPENRFTGLYHKYVRWEAIDDLNDFSEFAKENNVHVFFLYPAYPLSEYEKFEDTFSKLSEDIEKELDIEVLNEPTTLALPDSLFFDTVYHLTREGRTVRTQKVIDLIKNSKDALQAITAARNNKTP